MFSSMRPDVRAGLRLDIISVVCIKEENYKLIKAIGHTILVRQPLHIALLG